MSSTDDKTEEKPKLQTELEGASGGRPRYRTRIGSGEAGDSGDSGQGPPNIPPVPPPPPPGPAEWLPWEPPDLGIGDLPHDDAMEELRRIAWEVYPQFFANWSRMERVLSAQDETDQAQLTCRYKAIDKLSECYRSMEAWWREKQELIKALDNWDSEDAQIIRRRWKCGDKEGARKRIEWFDEQAEQDLAKARRMYAWSTLIPKRWEE